MPSVYHRRFDKEDIRLKEAKPGDTLIDDRGDAHVIDFLTEEGHPVNTKGTDLVTGRFAKGNNHATGRRKGSRNKLTQKLLDTMANSEVEVGEALLQMYLSEQTTPKEKISCLKTLADIIFPRTSSVELDVNDNSEKSKDAIDAELQLMMLRLMSGKK